MSQRRSAAKVDTANRIAAAALPPIAGCVRGTGGAVLGWIVRGAAAGPEGGAIGEEEWVGASRTALATKRANASMPAVLPRWIPSGANQLGWLALS